MGNEAVDIRKKELRRRFRTIRKELGEEGRAELDARIEANLVSLPEFEQTEVLLAYLDFGPEVRTRGIIQAAWDAGKTVALPWCVPGTHEMRWFKIESFNDLVRSSLGVEEPVPSDETEQLLGTGGGFYDTFLAKFDGVSVGLCREAQLSDDLRAEGIIDAHDLPAQLVVTDSRVIRV